MAPNPSQLGPAGVTTLVIPANPAVGTDFIITVPPDQVWRVLALAYTVTTAGGGPLRNFAVFFDNGGGNPFAAGCYDAGLNGGAVVRFFFSQGFGKPFNDQLAAGYGPLPRDILLYPGWRIRSSTFNIQAGDQLSSIVLTIR